MNERTVEELAQHVDGRVVGDGTLKISSVAGLAQARSGQVSFLANRRYTKMLATTNASAVVVGEPLECRAAQIVAKNPYYAFTQIAILLHGHRKHEFTGISSHAAIDPSASIGDGTRIQDFVSVGPKARVGRRCVIYSGVNIGPGTEIGDDCILYPNVVVYDGVQIGHRVIIQANASVGGDGYGFATHQGVHHKIPHIGKVIVENDVELGANCAVERGAMTDTIIGRGSKIGDLVAIGHGVQVGPGCLIVAQTGIAGSTTLGRYCVIAGQVAIAGHLKIGDQVTIAGRSGVTGDLASGEKVFGLPAFELRQALQAYSLIKSLPEFRDTLRELEQRVAELETEHRADEKKS